MFVRLNRVMNYQRLYDSIITNAMNRTNVGYVETHHIIPKSIGGLDTSNNLVALTTREHFICHYLLTKLYEVESFEWYKMNHAFLMMRGNPSVRYVRYFNSRLYASRRGDFSKTMSHAQKGNRNSSYGTRWIYNPIKQENKKNSFAATLLATFHVHVCFGCGAARVNA